jgi:hypothetical protein
VSVSYDIDRGPNNSHEEGEELHDVLQELALAANVDQSSETDLGNDGSEFTGSSADTVGSGSVSGREGLSGDD